MGCCVCELHLRLFCWENKDRNGQTVFPAEFFLPSIPYGKEPSFLAVLQSRFAVQKGYAGEVLMEDCFILRIKYEVVKTSLECGSFLFVRFF